MNLYRRIFETERPKGRCFKSLAVSDRCKIKMFHFNSSTVYMDLLYRIVVYCFIIFFLLFHCQTQTIIIILNNNDET
jgi:hypothetical protein